jgi:hypothetical protein
MEWHYEGYVFPENAAVAKQFLVNSMYDFDFAMKHFEKARPRLEKATDDTLYAGMDTINGCPYYPLFRTLELDEFKNTKIDVIMATVYDHQKTFKMLRDNYKPVTKLIREEGNPGLPSDNIDGFDALLTSNKKLFASTKAKYKVLYHQRFDSNVFAYSPPSANKVISCFMPTFRTDSKLVAFMEKHAEILTEFEFRDYGHVSPKNGSLSTKTALARAMNDSAFVWQVKPIGDGFGHVIHNAFALGRPPITVAGHYDGTLASELMIDGETSIWIEEKRIEDNCSKIRHAMDHLPAISSKTTKKFLEITHEEEVIQIRKFLG